MTDDRFVKDTARDPEREALGSMRAGLRAAAKKAVRKVAKKAGRKKVAKKATAAAGKTATRGAAPAKKADRAARTTADAPASGSAGARASDGAAKSRTPKAAAGPAAASESVAATSVAPAAQPRESGPSIDTPRPPGPMHPGAVMDSMQEQAGGLGGLLALWGPLIIVGFLVLVFRGDDEPETTVAAGADAPEPATIDATAGTMRAAAPSGAAPGAAETFDGGFAMRTSMAGQPVLAGRGAGAPAVAPGALYPSPPGPYRDPRYRSLPTGESWSAEGTGEWMWSAEARAGSRPAAGGAAPARWVRCEAPYYWCPAPTSPAW